MRCPRCKTENENKANTCKSCGFPLGLSFPRALFLYQLYRTGPVQVNVPLSTLAIIFLKKFKKQLILGVIILFSICFLASFMVSKISYFRIPSKITKLETFIKEQPEDRKAAEAQLRIGLLYLSLDKEKEAKEAFQKVIKNFPEENGWVFRAKSELKHLKKP